MSEAGVAGLKLLIEDARLTGRSDKTLATSVDGDTALATAVLAAMKAV